MGSKIKLRTFSSVDDKRIRLTNSNAARLWSADVGTSWSKIRIGCRIGIEDTGAGLTSTPRFAFGICSGTSNIYMDATTTHWCGILTNAATWSRFTGPTFYQIAAGGLVVAKRIGSTLTTGSGIGDYSNWHDCAAATRKALFLDITKGSPNFTFNLFYEHGAFSSVDVSLATLLAQLPLSSPAITDHESSSNVTLAIDEATNGYFNAVNFAWDRTSPAIEISDMAVVKLA